MATYTFIAKTILATTPNVVTFSSIPSTYSDLLILSSTRSTRTGTSFTGDTITFNAAQTDVGYSGRMMVGYGNTAYQSGGMPGSPYIGSYIAYSLTAGHTSNVYSNNWLYLFDYNNNERKQFLAESHAQVASTNSICVSQAGTWDSTAAITSISIYCNGNFGGHSYASGSSFYLFGVKRK